jgi:alpha-galactosidase
MLLSLLFGLALASSIFGATINGIAGSAPTAGPSHATGKLPALGYALIYYYFKNSHKSHSSMNLSWNTWNAYGCGMFGPCGLMSPILIGSGLVQDISDTKILAAAKQFVSLGLKDAGYQYVNIDVRHIFSGKTGKQKTIDYPFF